MNLEQLARSGSRGLTFQLWDIAKEWQVNRLGMRVGNVRIATNVRRRVACKHRVPPCRTRSVRIGPLLLGHARRRRFGLGSLLFRAALGFEHDLGGLCEVHLVEILL